MGADQGYLTKIIDSVTINSDYTSNAFPAQFVDALGFEFAWASGSGITGTVTIEASVSGNNWIALTTAQFNPATAMAISGASGVHIRDVTGRTGLMQFRYNFTIANAGSMVVNAWIGAKRG